MKLLYIQLALGLFQADLAVKNEIETHPEFEEEQSFLHDRVRIRKLHNDGLAGGRWSGHMPAIVRGSGLITIGSVIAFLASLRQEGHTAEKLGFSFLVGGALSNLYDRCRRGYVVDYVSFRTPWKRLSQLVFNLADFFIMIGAVLVCFGQTGHSQR